MTTEAPEPRIEAGYTLGVLAEIAGFGSAEELIDAALNDTLLEQFFEQRRQQQQEASSNA